MEQILVVVFWKDIPQFELFLHSLNKYWISNKNIKIVISDKVNTEFNKDTTRVNRNRIYNTIKTIVDNQLDNNWTYEIKFGDLNCWALGWHEQQLYKVIESNNSNFEHIVVFDSKDVLIKEYGIKDLIIKNNRYLIKRKITNDFSSSNYFSVKMNYMCSNLTPWIWNKYDLEKFVSFLTKKEKSHLIELEYFPGIYEIECFYLFNMLKNTNSRYRYVALSKIKKDFVTFTGDKNVVNESDVAGIKLRRDLLSNQFNKTVVNMLTPFLDKNILKKWQKESIEFQNNWKEHHDLLFYYYKDYIYKNHKYKLHDGHSCLWGTPSP